MLLALALAIPIYTLEPLHRARWAPVDDHEIVGFVLAAERLAVRHIPEVIRHTELGAAGHIARFRPVFHVLRVVEMSLWGRRPAAWYRSRLVLYSLSILLVGWTLAPRLGLVATAGLLLWVLSGPFWFHVWRLGAAEAYAVFGCALWAFGVHLLWPWFAPPRGWARWRLRLGALALVLGSALAIGSKEPLLVLAVPNLVLAVVEWRAGRAGGARWWAALAGVGVAVVVVTPLAIHFAGSPVDFYGNPVGVRARLAVLMAAIVRPTAVHAGFVLALALWLGVRVAARVGPSRTAGAGRRLTSWLLIASAAALGLYLSQVVFYNGTITPGTHYEFPAALATPAMLVAASLCIRAWLRQVGGPRAGPPNPPGGLGRPGEAVAPLGKTGKAERVVSHVTAAVFLGLALATASGYVTQRGTSQFWVTWTRGFTKGIDKAADTARAAPETPIVIASGMPSDLEPIVSIERFLRARGVPNPRFLVLDWEPGRARWTALDAHLAPQLERIKRGDIGFGPIPTLTSETPCFSIGVRHDPHRPCRSLGRIGDDLTWRAPDGVR